MQLNSRGWHQPPIQQQQQQQNAKFLVVGEACKATL